MKRLATAKPMKTKAPTRVTTLTDTFLAIKAPQMTARPVHMKWPRTPPTHTPDTSFIPEVKIRKRYMVLHPCEPLACHNNSCQLRPVPPFGKKGHDKSVGEQLEYLHASFAKPRLLSDLDVQRFSLCLSFSLCPVLLAFLNIVFVGGVHVLHLLLLCALFLILRPGRQTRGGSMPEKKQNVMLSHSFSVFLCSPFLSLSFSMSLSLFVLLCHSPGCNLLFHLSLRLLAFVCFHLPRLPQHLQRKARIRSSQQHRRCPPLSRRET